MGWQIFENAAIFLQGFLCFSFLTELLESRYSDKKKWLAVILATGVASIGEYIGRVILHSERFSLLVLIGVMAVYSFWCLRRKCFTKIIYIVAALVAMVCFFLFTSVLKIEPEIFSQTKQPERIIFIVTGMVLLFSVMQIILKIKVREFSWSDDGAFILIPILTLIILIVIQKIFIHDGKRIVETKYLMLLFIGLIISNIVVYFLAFNLSKKREELLRYKMQSQNIKEIISLNEESRKIRHDMKNILLAVTGYLEEGKIDNAKSYLKMIEQDKITVLSENVYCDNIVVNYLIKQKSSECQKRNIHFTCMTLCGFSEVSDVDLCILIGNALDNAIEASEQVKNSEVVLQIEEKGGYLNILVKNKFEKSVLKENPKLVTTKKEKQHHGLGIRSMKTIVEKYYGVLDFYEKDNYFYCRSLLKKD